MIGLGKVAHLLRKGIELKSQLVEELEQMRVPLRDGPCQDIGGRDRFRLFSGGGGGRAVQRVNGVIG